MTAAKARQPEEAVSADPEDQAPSGYVSLAEAARVLNVSDETLRSRYRRKPPAIPMWRDRFGRVWVDIRNPPPDLVKLGRRVRQDAAEAVAAADASGALPALRHHLLWLEGLVEQLQARAAAQAAESHEERQRLLGVIERLTGRPAE